MFFPFQDFQELRKLTATGILSKVSDSLSSLSTLHIEAHRSPELERVNDYLANLSDKLTRICKISQRIHKERSGEFWLFDYFKKNTKQ